MIPHTQHCRYRQECFPRVSGDDPDAGYAAETAEAFSPRERG